MVNWGVSKNTINDSKLNGRNGWSFINDPDDNRKVLIHYELLKDKYKRLIELKLGCNPYEYMSKTSIKSLLKPDYEAEKFFEIYTYGDEIHLPIEYQEKYAEAARWLNMLLWLNGNRKVLKKQLKISWEKFWSTVSEIIEAEEIALPSSYRNLLQKIKSFDCAQDDNKRNYACLIDGRFGNDHAKKIRDEVAESLLFELIAHPHEFDDVFICEKYNEWAQKSGRKLLESPATVGNYRRKNGFVLDASRYGNSQWYDKYGLSIPQKRASAPLLQINSDDNNLDILFFNPDTKNHYNRAVLIVVNDSYNDMPLGYSWRIAASPTNEMIYAAYLDAAYYVKQQLGDWYMWHEIKSDRWSIKSLKPWYESQAIYTGTAHKNARGKLIEQSFSHQFNQIKKKYHGYTGHNISAKTRGVNQDFLNADKQNYYLTTEAGSIVESIMNEMRNLPGKYNKNITREQEWMEAFTGMDERMKRRVDDTWVLNKLGKTTEKPVSITNKGVQVQINNERFLYQVPANLHQRWIGSKVNVHYDGIDMSRILITNEEGIQEVIHTFERVPGAAMDHVEGSRTYLNQLITVKKIAAQHIADADKKRKETLRNEGINLEAVMLTGPSVDKELMKAAEYKALTSSYEDADDDNIMTLDEIRDLG